MHPTDIGKPHPEWVGWSKENVYECFEEQKPSPKPVEQPVPKPVDKPSPQPKEQLPKVVVVEHKPLVHPPRMHRRKLLLFILLILVSLLLGFFIYQSKSQM